jgi:hypothetical protein
MFGRFWVDFTHCRIDCLELETTTPLMDLQYFQVLEICETQQLQTMPAYPRSTEFIGAK